MSYSITDLKSDSEFPSILEKSKKVPIIVDFFANWCGPCMKLKPLLEEEVKKNGLNLCAVNVDICREIPDKYGVNGIPHVILLIDGKEVKKFVGFDLNSLKEMIQFAKSKTNKFQGTGTALGSAVHASANNDTTPIPPEPTGDDCYEIMFKYNAKSFARKFEGTNTIAQLKAYVRKEVGAGNIKIFTPFPRKYYDNDSSTIIQAGLSKREALMVELK